MSIKMTRRSFLKTTGIMAVGAGILSRTEALAKAAPQPSPYSTKLPQRILGKTGVSVSILGLGGAWTMGQTDDIDLCQKIVNEAIDLGINYVDTAPNYQKSEEHIGLVMAKRRKEVFLATKCEDRTYDGAMKQVENSLKMLQTDHIDLLQVHYIAEKEDIKPIFAPTGVLKALQKLRDQKVIRFIGVSGHPTFAPVKEVLKMYDWDTFLGFVNPQKDTQGYFTDQLPLAQRKKMGLIAMKAFGGGSPSALVGTAVNQATAQNLLRYTLTKPIHVAIVAAATVEHVRQNLETVKSFRPMTDGECSALEAKINTPVPKKA